MMHIQMVMVSDINRNRSGKWYGYGNSTCLLTTHSKVTGSPVEARIVLEGMAAAGRSLNKCRNTGSRKIIYLGETVDTLVEQYLHRHSASTMWYTVMKVTTHVLSLTSKELLFHSSYTYI
jgi:hypothetical protein